MCWRESFSSRSLTSSLSRYISFASLKTFCLEILGLLDVSGLCFVFIFTGCFVYYHWMLRQSCKFFFLKKDSKKAMKRLMRAAIGWFHTSECFQLCTRFTLHWFSCKIFATLQKKFFLKNTFGLNYALTTPKWLTNQYTSLYASFIIDNHYELKLFTALNILITN